MLVIYVLFLQPHQYSIIIMLQRRHNTTMNEKSWRQGSMVEQYKYMLESGYLSDCCFLVGQEPDAKKFRAHKMILSRSSEVFHAMFYGLLSEQDLVRVTDITPAAFQALLYHVYCDSLEVSDVEMALSVSFAAHKYNLQTLSNKCIQYMSDHMIPENVCEVLAFADLCCNTQLKQHCIKLLQNETEAVLSADSWCDAPESSIVTLLQQDTLNIDSELSLFTACHCWALHQLTVNNQPDGDSKRKLNKKYINNVSKLRKILEPLLLHIRILNVTAKKFLQIIKEVPIFSEQEQLMILKRYIEPDKEYKIPTGFCEINTERQLILKRASGNSCVYVVYKKLQLADLLGLHAWWYDFHKEKQLERMQFQSLNDTVSNSQNSSCCLDVTENIAIYGFQFHAMEFAGDNKYKSTCTLANRNEYCEKFTLYFWNTEGECDVKCEFDGKLIYGEKEDIFFPKPFLVIANKKHYLKLEFRDKEIKMYQLSCGLFSTNDDAQNLKITSSYRGLSQILYKSES